MRVNCASEKSTLLANIVASNRAVFWNLTLRNRPQIQNKGYQILHNFKIFCFWGRNSSLHGASCTPADLEFFGCPRFPLANDLQFPWTLDVPSGLHTHPLTFTSSSPVSDSHSTAAYFWHDPALTAPVYTMGFPRLCLSLLPPKPLLEICFWLNILCQISFHIRRPPSIKRQGREMFAGYFIGAK